MVIPPRIIQMWIGPPPPPYIAAHMAGWEAFCQEAGWEYRLYGDDARKLLSHRMREAWDRCPDMAFEESMIPRERSNLFRIEALHRLGGIWLDTDTEFWRDPTPLLHQSAFLVWELPGVTCNSPWGSEPGHPFAARVKARVPELYRRYRHRPIKGALTGPRFISQSLTTDVTILEASLWWQYYWRDLNARPTAADFPEAFGSHHWHHARTRAGKVLDNSRKGALTSPPSG